MVVILRLLQFLRLYLIEPNAFPDMANLTSVLFEPYSSLTDVSDNAFTESKTTHFVFPKSVTNIGEFWTADPDLVDPRVSVIIPHTATMAHSATHSYVFVYNTNENKFYQRDANMNLVAVPSNQILVDAGFTLLNVFKHYILPEAIATIYS